MQKKPQMMILFDQNYREGYYPARAFEAVKDKVDVTFKPIEIFDGAHIVVNLFGTNTTDTDFIAIDIPNAYTGAQVYDITFCMEFLPKEDRRKILFGVVENSEIYSNNRYIEPMSFLNTDQYPVVRWDWMKNLQNIGKYEVKHQLDKPKLFSKDWFQDRVSGLIY